MRDPFKLFRRVFIALFRVTGYTVVLVFQIIGYLYYRRRDKIIDAFGYYGRNVTDAFAAVMRD